MAKKLSGWLIDEIFDTLKTPAVYSDEHRANKDEVRDKNIITQFVPIDEFGIMI